ncbi:MAG: glutamate/aspartate ABC transporter substrate-binding protein [Terriglobales bacterium]
MPHIRFLLKKPVVSLMQWAAVSALVSAVLAAPAAAQQLTGTLKKIKDSGTITLGHRESSIPFSYYDQNQKVVGYSHEFALKVVDALKRDLKLPNLQVRLIPVTPENRISLMQNGTIDLECGSTTHNTTRDKQVAFSNTIFVIGTRLLTRKDFGIKDFPDLAGKNVVTTAGTTSEPILRRMNQEKNMGMNIIAAKDHGEAFLILQSGRAVAFMMDDVLLYGERTKARRPDDWIVTGTPQSHEAYGCMLRKDDPEFKKFVDTTLAKVMTSGEAEKIYKKWFQNPVPPKGLNLNLPLSPELAEDFKHPNDKPYQ